MTNDFSPINLPHPIALVQRSIYIYIYIYIYICVCVCLKKSHIFWQQIVLIKRRTKSLINTGPKTNIFKDTSYFVIRALCHFIISRPISVLSKLHTLTMYCTTRQTINIVLTNSRIVTVVNTLLSTRAAHILQNLRNVVWLVVSIANQM